MEAGLELLVSAGRSDASGALHLMTGNGHADKSPPTQ